MEYTNILNLREGGENTVFYYGDYIMVVGDAIGGFSASVYSFIETPEETGLPDEECRIELTEKSSEVYGENGRAIEWCLETVHRLRRD